MSASRPGRPLKSPAAIMRPYDPNVNPDCGFDFGGGCCSGLIVGGTSGACLTSGGCALGGGGVGLGGGLYGGLGGWLCGRRRRRLGRVGGRRGRLRRLRESTRGNQR